MLQITAIVPQKSNIRRSQNKEKRFNIYLDGKFGFAIGEENLLINKLKVGSTIAKEDIEKISKEESLKKLIDAAINFLSYRPRSEKEVSDYLIKKISQKEKIKYGEAKESNLIALVLKKLAKYAYIDDLNFANWWVESRSRARQKGKRVLSLELKQKGISQTLIEEVLSKSQNELELALKVIEKKHTRLEKLTDIEAKKKIYYYLASRGFEPTVIKEALQIFLKRDKIS